jgi:hypothetical protein
MSFDVRRSTQLGFPRLTPLLAQAGRAKTRLFISESHARFLLIFE